MDATGKICLREALRPATIKLRALLGLAVRCQACGATGASKQPSRTAYPDPESNTCPVLCPPCAQEYHDYWDCMWGEYWNSQR